MHYVNSIDSVCWRNIWQSALVQYRFTGPVLGLISRFKYFSSYSHTRFNGLCWTAAKWCINSLLKLYFLALKRREIVWREKFDSVGKVKLVCRVRYKSHLREQGNELSEQSRFFWSAEAYLLETRNMFSQTFEEK